MYDQVTSRAVRGPIPKGDYPEWFGIGDEKKKGCDFLERDKSFLSIATRNFRVAKSDIQDKNFKQFVVTLSEN